MSTLTPQAALNKIGSILNQAKPSTPTTQANAATTPRKDYPVFGEHAKKKKANSKRKPMSLSQAERLKEAFDRHEYAMSLIGRAHWILDSVDIFAPEALSVRRLFGRITRGQDLGEYLLEPGEYHPFDASK